MAELINEATKGDSSVIVWHSMVMNHMCILCGPNEKPDNKPARPFVMMTDTTQLCNLVIVVCATHISVFNKFLGCTLCSRARSLMQSTTNTNSSLSVGNSAFDSL